MTGHAQTPHRTYFHCPYCNDRLYYDSRQYFCWTCRLSWKSLSAVAKDRKALGKELGR